MPDHQDEIHYDQHSTSTGLLMANQVLRDSRGKILCVFSLYVGVCDSNEAELMAIKKAASLCTSNPILHGREIVIVSNSKVAVSWINDVGYGNLNYVDMVYDIHNFLDFLGGTVVSFSPRSMNSFADNLAKLGSSLAGDFIKWDDTL